MAAHCVQDLPLELLEECFQKLPLLQLLRASVTCKNFHLAAHAERILIWSSEEGVDFSELAHVLDDATLEAVLRRHPQIKGLGLAGCQAITDRSLALISNLSSLELLDLLGCEKVTEVGVQLLQPLSTLKLGGCVKVNLGTALVQEVATTSGPLLQCIDVGIQTPQRSGTGVSDEDLRALGKSCGSLRSLGLAFSHRVSSMALLGTLQQLPHLEALDLSFSKLSDLELEQFGQCLQNCQKLGLKACWRLQDPALHNMTQGMPTLQEIVLSKCTYISDDGIASVVENCPTLQSLDASGLHRLTDQSLQHLQALPSFSKLSVSLCDQLSDAGLEHFLVKFSSSLVALNVADCKQVMGSFMRLLLPSCRPAPSAAEQMGWVGPPPTTPVCRLEFPLLNSLNLRRCTALWDEPLACIAERCPGLTSLNISACSRLTDECLVSPGGVAGLERLQHLSAGHCDKFSDEGVGDVLERCTQLHTLSLVGTSITPSMLPCLDRCAQRGLLQLDVSFCAHLTPAMVQQSSLTKRSKHLHIIHRQSSWNMNFSLKSDDKFVLC